MDYVILPDGSIQSLREFKSEHKPDVSIPVSTKKSPRHRNTGFLRKIGKKLKLDPKNASESNAQNKYIEKSERSYVKCKVCNCVLWSENEEAHYRNVHRKQFLKLEEGLKGTNSIIENLPSQDASISPSALYDSANTIEREYAEKGLGQFRHEDNGRFGSLPLYDDYGDGDER